MKQIIEISTSTILRLIFIILAFVFVYIIRDVLLMLFFALIVSAAVDAPVDWLERHRVRRVFGAVIMYLLIILALALFSYTVFPTLAGQMKNLALNLPEYSVKLGVGLEIIQQKIGMDLLQPFLTKIGDQLSWASSNIFGAAANIFGGIFSAVVIFVISIYLVVQDKDIKNFLAAITPPGNRVYVLSLAERIQSKLGLWLRGQLFLMLIVALMSFIGLTFLQVKFALTLALLAGVFEIIPYFGPILGSIPAIILAFLQSPLLAVLVAALYLIIQKSENYLIAPMVMKKAIGINPLLVIISAIIGGKLYGILGIVVSIPLVAAVSVYLSDRFKKSYVE